MLNLLKERYELHAILLWLIICVVTVWMFRSTFHTQFVDKWHVCFIELCVDVSGNYSAQVLRDAYLPISGSYFSRSWHLKGTFKCIIPLWLLLAHCDYSWHGTTLGPQRSWAESRLLLLAWDYSGPVTPARSSPSVTTNAIQHRVRKWCMSRWHIRLPATSCFVCSKLNSLVYSLNCFIV